MLTLNAELLYTIVNLLIFYLLLRKFLFGPVNAIIEKRQRGIAEEREAAEQKTVEANALYEKYQQSLAHVEEEEKQILQGAKQRGQAEYEKILEHAKEEAQQLQANTEKSIAMQQQKALEEAKEGIAELAMRATAKLLEEKVDAKTDQKILDSFLLQAGDKL